MGWLVHRVDFSSRGNQMICYKDYIMLATEYEFQLCSNWIMWKKYKLVKLVLVHNALETDIIPMCIMYLFYSQQ